MMKVECKSVTCRCHSGCAARAKVSGDFNATRRAASVNSTRLQVSHLTLRPIPIFLKSLTFYREQDITPIIYRSKLLNVSEPILRLCHATC